MTTLLIADGGATGHALTAALRLGARLAESRSAPREVAGIIVEVPLIGLQRILRGATLGAHHFEERFDLMRPRPASFPHSGCFGGSIAPPAAGGDSGSLASGGGAGAAGGGVTCSGTSFSAGMRTVSSRAFGVTK